MDGQNPFEELNERLKRVEGKLDEVLKEKENPSKNLLSIDDLASYTGLAKSYLHKLSSSGELPYYKPFGKKLFFDREEIDNWLKRRKNSSFNELDQKAADHLNNKAKRGKR